MRFSFRLENNLEIPDNLLALLRIAPNKVELYLLIIAQKGTNRASHFPIITWMAGMIRRSTWRSTENIQGKKENP
jgi:hypothetical protein